MKIHLPNSAFLGNIDPFFRGFDPLDPNSLEITANEKWISVHPVVLSMIAALGVSTKPEIRCEKLEAKSKHYLVRMGLFKMLNIASDISIVEHEPAGRFIPLTQIHTSAELTKFITEMVPLLHLEPDQAQTIGYIVSELVRNVIEHANSKEGAFLCAQYYKKSNTIRIGIADTGVGIKTAISQSYSVKTDLEIYIKGGATYGKFAPPVHHFQNVLLPLLKRIGYEVRVNIIRHGFYPKGGAKVDIFSEIADLKPLRIPEKGEIVSIKGISIADQSLQKTRVAERQAEKARELLQKHFHLPFRELDLVLALSFLLSV